MAWEEIVADSAPGVASDFNTKVIEEFRANGGRAGLWPKLVAGYPSSGEFQARTTRPIPVFMLTRPGGPAGAFHPDPLPLP